jgi:hypothetical protein
MNQFFLLATFIIFRLGELLVIIPMHVVCIVSTFGFLCKVLPDQVASQALDPIEYLHDGNPWIVVRFQKKRK